MSINKYAAEQKVLNHFNKSAQLRKIARQKRIHQIKTAGIWDRLKGFFSGKDSQAEAKAQEDRKREEKLKRMFEAGQAVDVSRPESISRLREERLKKLRQKLHLPSRPPPPPPGFKGLPPPLPPVLPPDVLGASPQKPTAISSLPSPDIQAAKQQVTNPPKPTKPTTARSPHLMAEQERTVEERIKNLLNQNTTPDYLPEEEESGVNPTTIPSSAAVMSRYNPFTAPDINPEDFDEEEGEYAMNAPPVPVRRSHRKNRLTKLAKLLG
jgi:hypothetical protein